MECIEKPGEMNLTLVAFYGPKSAEIENLIVLTQQMLSNQLPNTFNPYTVEQVHATIVGLEGKSIGDRVANTNYLEMHRKIKLIAFDRLFKLLSSTTLLPFRIQIGGFKQSELYPFTSRGLHPHLRSFALRGQIAVAMGWPIEDDTSYSMSLDRLRRCFNDCNVLHKYHDTPEAIDNDFFFVLGRVDREKLKESEIQNVQYALREYLSQIEPVFIKVEKKDLLIVAYTNPQLPFDESCRIPLNEAEADLDRIIRLYCTVGA